jgi:hypothetical protein
VANQVSVKQVVGDPNWFLHSINLDKASLSFVKTNKVALSEASFLDSRFDVAGLTKASFGLQELLEHTRSLTMLAAVEPKFIFHTAFCCSTLLARCLDLPGCSVSLKEPEVLMELSNYHRVKHKLLSNAADAKAIYQLVTFLLFRPFADGELVVVKPTNTVNNIINPLMAAHKNSKAVLLHSDLKSFMLSTLKKGERGRSFARQLFKLFSMDSQEVKQLDQQQLMAMTDMQITAITWHLQLENFFAATQQFGRDQVRSLHCDQLLSNPAQTLTKVVDCLDASGLQQNFDQLMVNAPLNKNAKETGQAFSATDREAEYRQIEQQFSDSLQTIIPWAEQLRFKYAYSANIDYAL